MTQCIYLGEATPLWMERSCGASIEDRRSIASAMLWGRRRTVQAAANRRRVRALRDAAS